ncbi:hypothetical protein Dalk_3579 [Desulfatibacillum aliphaticivorans]|uniref:Uncharacterized protein n=1 Tax=Desulfatibacillum aliphaticivorans TaxID=218208 RepID=B8FGN7_DESAL|nr:hypothetical protein [Desulfatibacillum aliphaticivorans]ACL05267.1 hypothetical protein Dalk_3579 [Desulfatibacillum aliphaticivorans]
MAKTQVIQVMEERSPLSKKEQDRRRELEGLVMKNMAAFLEMGAALAEIQRDRLYRSTHRNFEAYVRDVFEIGKSYAHRQIAGYQVVENIRSAMAPDGKNVANWRQILPANEAQVRPLTLLDDPEEQVEAWKHAVKIGEDSKRGKVTARHVAQAVGLRRGVSIAAKIQKVRTCVDKVEICSKKFKEASELLLALVQEEIDSGFQTTSKEAIAAFSQSLSDLVEAA